MNRTRPSLWQIAMILTLGLLATAANSQGISSKAKDLYIIQPGDKLRISVWNEPDLNRELLVAPDGTIAFPLVGEIDVSDMPVSELRTTLSKMLQHFISEPIVTASISEVLGNKIYVLGQVNRPGNFVVNPMVDVMQALSMAGGTNAFASLNNIVILRRQGSKEVAIPFKYGDVSSGKNLEQNIVLQSGDVVVVP